MPQRGMVYGINGFTRPDSISVLSDISQRDLAEQLPQREHPGQDVRRDYDRQFTESGIKSLERSSFLCETMFQTLNEAAEKTKLQRWQKFAEILILSGFCLLPPSVLILFQRSIKSEQQRTAPPVFCGES